jgi:hypothetical protein
VVPLLAQPVDMSLEESSSARCGWGKGSVMATRALNIE